MFIMPLIPLLMFLNSFISYAQTGTAIRPLEYPIEGNELQRCRSRIRNEILGELVNQQNQTTSSRQALRRLSTNSQQALEHAVRALNRSHNNTNIEEMNRLIMRQGLYRPREYVHCESGVTPRNLGDNLGFDCPEGRNTESQRLANPHNPRHLLNSEGVTVSVGLPRLRGSNAVISTAQLNTPDDLFIIHHNGLRITFHRIHIATSRSLEPRLSASTVTGPFLDAFEYICWGSVSNPSTRTCGNMDQLIDQSLRNRTCEAVHAERTHEEPTRQSSSVEE